MSLLERRLQWRVRELSALLKMAPEGIENLEGGFVGGPGVPSDALQLVVGAAACLPPRHLPRPCSVAPDAQRRVRR